MILRSYVAFVAFGALIGFILGVVVLFTNDGDWAAFWTLIGLFAGVLLILRILWHVATALYDWVDPS